MGNFRFRVFLAGQAVSLVGDGIAILAVPLFMLTVTDNPLLVGLAAAPRMVGYLVVGLPAGVLVDRVDARRAMFVADVVRAASFLALTSWSYLSLAPPWLVLALVFVAGGASAVFESALAVAVKDAVRDDEFLRANSLLQLAAQSSLVAGPAIVGLLVGVAGISAALATNAATFLVSLATLPALRPTHRPGGPTTPTRVVGAARTAWADLRRGLHYLVANRLVFAFTVLTAVVNVFVAVETLLVYYVREDLRISEGVLSLIVMSGGVGGILGALLAGAVVRGVGERPAFVVGLGSLGLAIGVMGAAGSPVVLVIANLVAGAGTIVATVVSQSLRQRVVPREILGRVTSAAKVLALSAYQAGIFVAGAAAALDDGARPVFLVAGGVSVVVTVGAWFWIRRPAEVSVIPS